MTISIPNKPRYNASISSASLIPEDTYQFSLVYLETGDWDETRQVLVQKEPYRLWKRQSFNNKFHMVRRRLKHLPDELIQWSVDHDTDRIYIYFIAACEEHLLLRDFVLELVRDQYLLLKRTIHEDDIRSFFNQKIQDHEELEQMQPNSFRKVRQVILRIVRETGILIDGETRQIIKPLISSELAELLHRTNPRFLKYLLWADHAIETLNHDV